MEALTLNNLLVFLRGLSISDREWLVAHLVEPDEKVSNAKVVHKKIVVSKKDFEIPSDFQNMFDIDKPLPKEYDERKEYGEYQWNKLIKGDG